MPVDKKKKSGTTKSRMAKAPKTVAKLKKMARTAKVTTKAADSGTSRLSKSGTKAAAVGTAVNRLTGKTAAAKKSAKAAATKKKVTRAAGVIMGAAKAGASGYGGSGKNTMRAASLRGKRSGLKTVMAKSKAKKK